MDKLIRFAAVMTAIVLLSGCTVNNSGTKNSGAQSQETGSGLPQEVGIAVECTTSGGYVRQFETGGNKSFAADDLTKAVIRVNANVNLKELEEHIRPKSEAVVVELQPGSAEEAEGGLYQVAIDVSGLRGERKVTLAKGLKSADGKKELLEDCVLDFGATELHVKLQRLDPITGKETPFTPNVVDTAVKLRLSFDLPADQASVEESIRTGLLKHDGRLFGPNKEIDVNADFSFEWASDTSCMVSVKELEYGYTYGVSLMDAHAQDGSRILEDHTSGGYNFWPYFTKTDAPWENFTYIFQYREPQQITALSLKDGSERAVQSIGDAFLSFGPVSPNGRYIAVKPNQFDFDHPRNNIVLFDCESGTLLQSEEISARYFDEIALDNMGRAYTNWTRRDEKTGLTFFLAESENYHERLAVKDDADKVVSTIELKPNYHNFCWMQGGRIVYDWWENEKDTVSVINTQGETVKTFAGYRLLSALPDGSLLAIVKDNIVEIYDTSWVKKGAFDLGKQGVSIRAEGEPDNLREALRLFWGSGKVCLVYLKYIGENNGHAPMACSWNYETGKTVTADIPFTDMIEYAVPLYFDSKQDELYIVKDAWQMWASYTYAP